MVEPTNYPLQWPDFVPRTDVRRDSGRFNTRTIGGRLGTRAK